MSTTVTSSTSAPAVAAPKVDAPTASPAAPVVDTTSNVVAPNEGDLSSLSVKELTNLQRTADQRKRAPAKAIEPAVVAPVVEKKAPVPTYKPVEAAAVVVKAEDKSTDKPDDAAKPPQYRLRGRDSKEDAFLALVSAGRSIPDATAIVYPDGVKSAVAAQPGTDETVDDDAPIVAHITRIDGEIKTATTELEKLDADLAKAAAESDLEAVTRINRDITRKERAIDKLNGLKESHEGDCSRLAQQNQVRAEKSDHDQVVKNYPELGDRNSPEYGKFMQFFRAKEAIANTHPRSVDAQILALPNWRSLFVREFVEQEGMTPAHRRTAKPAEVTAPEITAPPPKVERPQASAAKVLTTTDQPEGATFEITAKDVETKLEGLSVKQLGELQRNADRLRREQSRRPAA